MAYAPGASQLFIGASLFAGITVGLITNFVVLGLLRKIERNGIRCVLVQLVLADILLLAGPSVVEIWTLNGGDFVFGKSGCIAYQGLEVFGSTSMLYFTVTLGLHALSFLRKRKLRFEDDGEVESSRRTLVGGDTSTPPRMMGLNYQEKNKDISVACPVAIVWILAASLSVPKILLASLVSQEDNHLVCTFLEPAHKPNALLLLKVFNLILPLILLVLTGLITLVNICKQRPLKSSESKPYLLLFLFIFMIYIFFCLPRSLLDFYNSILPPKSQDLSHSPPETLMSQRIEQKHLSVLFTYLYYLSCLLRPLMCIATIPQIRSVFKKNNDKM